jgi:N,N'-diacetylbacillosaminyl-diphospho-undecaprenol alpha-1,3-N-acetylgalactosaminyltransferase
MKIIHFHADARMAAQFIAPLMEAERGEGYQTGLVSSVRRLGQECIVIPFDLSVSNLLGLPLALWRIVSHLKRCCPDVVFSHNTKSSLLPLLGARLVGVRVRVYFNHGVPYVAYRGMFRCLLRALERWNSGLATHVVAVSPDMFELLKDVSPGIKVQVIKNGSASGIDLNAFSPERYSRADWRKAHSLRDEDLVAIFVGRPEKRKGFVFVLRLWADYLRDTHFKLVLCGPGQDDVLKCLGTLPANVISMGFVNNIPEVMAGSDLLILPSLHEGLSYACLEAQASGLVVLANDISGIRCVIKDGVNGFLVSDNDPSKYIEIIQKIDKDRTAFADIRRRARSDVERFSRKLFIPSYLSFLSSLLPK